MDRRLQAGGPSGRSSPHVLCETDVAAIDTATGTTVEVELATDRSALMGDDRHADRPERGCENPNVVDLQRKQDQRRLEKQEDDTAHEAGIRSKQERGGRGLTTLEGFNQEVVVTPSDSKEKDTDHDRSEGDSKEQGVEPARGKPTVQKYQQEGQNRDARSAEVDRRLAIFVRVLETEHYRC
jgi:hypothetical protein